jgi:hypothetical protein
LQPLLDTDYHEYPRYMMTVNNTPKAKYGTNIGLGIVVAWLWLWAGYGLYRLPLLKAVNDEMGLSTGPMLKMLIDLATVIILNWWLVLLAGVIVGALSWRVRVVRLPLMIASICIPILILMAIETDQLKTLQLLQGRTHAIAFHAEKK